MRKELAVAAALTALAWGQGARAENRTAAGDFTVERPTLVSLGFHWRIAGDDNRNARVEVAYRKKGETAWRDGLPLMRSQNEVVGAAPGPGAADANPRYPLFRYTVGNLFSGSLLNLDPDTEYECRFTLVDPDGVSGTKTRTVSVRTRKEPQPAAGGANYNYFEGITVRNTNVAFLLGIKGIAGASGFTLKRSKLYDVGRAVQDDWSGSKDFYIADNELTGRHEHVKIEAGLPLPQAAPRLRTSPPFLRFV